MVGKPDLNCLLPLLHHFVDLGEVLIWISLVDWLIDLYWSLEQMF